MSPKIILQFAIGPIGGAFLGFISLPIITWFFSQEIVGKVALIHVVLSLTTLFFSFGLDQAYVREYHRFYNKIQLFKMVLLPGFILILVMSAIFFWEQSFISKFVFSYPSILVSVAIYIAVFVSFLSRFLSLILRMNNKGVLFSISQILPKFVLLILVLFFVLFDMEKSFENLIIANVVSFCVACFFLLLVLKREMFLTFKSEFKLTEFSKLIKFGAPLALGSLAFWGMTSLDRVLLSELSDYNELAIYTVSVSFAAVAGIFQSLFSTLWSPMVYKWIESSEDYENIERGRRYVLLVVALIFGFGGIFSWLPPILLPVDYSQVGTIFIACLSYPLLYTLSETTVVGIGVTRKSNYAMFACLLALSINVLLNLFLIPPFGASGAAVSTAISFWFFLFFRTEFAIFLWKPISRFRIYFISFLSVLGASMAALFGEELTFEIYFYWMIYLLIISVLLKKEIYESLGLFQKVIKNRLDVNIP